MGEAYSPVERQREPNGTDVVLMTWHRLLGHPSFKTVVMLALNGQTYVLTCSRFAMTRRSRWWSGPRLSWQLLPLSQATPVLVPLPPPHLHITICLLGHLMDRVPAWAESFNATAVLRRTRPDSLLGVTVSILELTMMKPSHR